MMKRIATSYFSDVLWILLTAAVCVGWMAGGHVELLPMVALALLGPILVQLEKRRVAIPIRRSISSANIFAPVSRGLRLQQHDPLLI